MGFISRMFNSNIKKFSFSCPMCERVYNIEFDITEADKADFYSRDPEDGTHSDYYRELNTVKCEFCKTELVILFANDHSKVKALDVKWEAVENQYDKESSEAQDAFDEMDAEIEDEGSTHAREKKKQQLQAKIDKLEAAYETKEDRYIDRQCNWSEKWQDKLERMGD